MSVKVTVLYNHPADPAAFEKHYNDVHVGLAAKIPNVERAVLSRVLSNADGSPATLYRTADLYFKDLPTMQAALGSPEGQTTAQDAVAIATGGIAFLVCDIDD